LTKQKLPGKFTLNSLDEAEASGQVDLTLNSLDEAEASGRIDLDKA